MCFAEEVSGTHSEGHADRMCAAAVDLLSFTQRARREKLTPAGWHIRLGMSSGPLSSGVVGTDRLSYDVWGDTVNTAARVASASSTDQILLSDTTRVLLSDVTRVADRGQIDAKGKGMMDVYALIIAGQDHSM